MGRNLPAGAMFVLLTQYRQVLLSDQIFEKRGLDTESNLKNDDSVKENLSCNKVLMAYYVQGANWNDGNDRESPEEGWRLKSRTVGYPG